MLLYLISECVADVFVFNFFKFCNFSSLDIACSQLFLFDEVNETHDWLVSLLTFNRASLCHHAYLLKLILRFGEN